MGINFKACLKEKKYKKKPKTNKQTEKPKQHPPYKANCQQSIFSASEADKEWEASAACVEPSC